MEANDILFEPLRFPTSSLKEVKNRVFRSSISGRFDNYDGSGTHARMNWEEKFARGGVGAIITSYIPVHVRGRILPNFAMIDKDDKIPFWKAVVERVHQYKDERGDVFNQGAGIVCQRQVISRCNCVQQCIGNVRDLPLTDLNKEKPVPRHFK